MKEGDKFHELTAIERSHHRIHPFTRNVTVYWWFECSCGRRKRCNVEAVERGLSKSCGHLQSEHASRNARKYFPTMKPRPSKPVCAWVSDESNGKPVEKLIKTSHSGRRKHLATVWPNGVWHTWDYQGTGLENSVEPTVDQAKRAAAGACVAQGLI